MIDEESILFLRTDEWNVMKRAALLRNKASVTLADAVIAATAVENRLSLATRDKILAKRLKGAVDVIGVS